MAGPLLGATIALGMQDGGVPPTVNKLTADLSSAERAGRRAETASKAAAKAADSAEKATHALAHRATHAVRELRHAVHLLEKAAKFAGSEEGGPLGIGLEALSGGAQAFRFGNALGGPIGGAVAFGAGAIFSGYQAYSKSQEEQAKRDREGAEKLAEEMTKALARQRDANLDAIVREQAGVKQIASLFGGVRHDL